ncbi:YvaD family protein [Kamptonema formosum]|uniref:YvaD family protein n=1 Tax=Kamptonema formosum TaxID=331992 RepID=UPI00037B7917
MKRLKNFFLVTDIGFILYWLITLFHLLPESYLFKDYNNPILVAWNWSFLPLDLLISATGFFSLFLYTKGRKNWDRVALVSLILTFCSGLQAISFWTLRADFDLNWWLPNLFLLLYPMFFIPRFISNKIGE